MPDYFLEVVTNLLGVTINRTKDMGNGDVEAIN